MHRHIFFGLSLLGTASLLIAWLFMQNYLNLEPCPLCIIDRYAIGVFSLAAFLSWIVYPRLLWVWIAGMGFSLLVGLVSTVRHVYMEWFPDKTATCFFPAQQNTLADFFVNAFAGSSDCSVVSWTFLGISLAEMTFLLMVFLTIVLIYNVFLMLKRQNTHPDT